MDRYQMSRHLGIGLTIAVLLSACTAPSPRPSPAPSGQVGYELADAAIQAGSRLQLAANESFQPPLPTADNAPPMYPDELLARRLPPQAVCLRVAIDERGQVFNTALVDLGVDCSGTLDRDPAFQDAAIAAALRWRFEPAFRCVFPEGRTPEAACGTHGTQEVPQPVSLVYRFVFEQDDGQGRVRID